MYSNLFELLRDMTWLTISVGLAVLEKPGRETNPNWLDAGLGLRRRWLYRRKKAGLKIAGEFGICSKKPDSLFEVDTNTTQAS